MKVTNSFTLETSMFSKTAVAEEKQIEKPSEENDMDAATNTIVEKDDQKKTKLEYCQLQLSDLH